MEEDRREVVEGERKSRHFLVRERRKKARSKKERGVERKRKKRHF